MDDITPQTHIQRRLAALMDRAVDTLEALLDDPALSAERRAELAERLLTLAVAGETKAPSAGPVPARTVLPGRGFTIPDFLPPALHAKAVEAALQLRDKFIASAVTSNEPGVRKSRVLFEDSLPELYPAMRQQIEFALPAACIALARPTFAPSRVELQITVHGDGDYFKPHTDAGAPEIATRELSFAYYFIVRQPCGFRGGALRLYDTLNMEPARHDTARFEDVTPADNMIVFFESRLMHEVLPLHVASGEFGDGRFTLNGWLHR